MRRTYHPELVSGRWFTFSLVQQLGNVGSEYERVLKWKDTGDQAHYENALGRFMELIELTIADPRWKKSRQKKLINLKEEILHELLDDKHPGKGDFQKYFFRVALAARRAQ